MAGGGFVSDSGTGKAYAGKLTRNVVVTCIVASKGGFIFGYDIGISCMVQRSSQQQAFRIGTTRLRMSRHDTCTA
ncbi:hypothetical protein RHMOL_Rhmol02G0277200 [Rhododendron molle]|uniref:Uncharacterized protein n=1 Tax=Rhododendron molle TaxID=49168 RepID=A0ACC0PW80_RHOML|nr:hypothetical protein RHMOL_Rhmol02G0277200 [Rhododendron molle]